MDLFWKGMTFKMTKTILPAFFGKIRQQKKLKKNTHPRENNEVAIVTYLSVNTPGFKSHRIIISGISNAKAAKNIDKQGLIVCVYNCFKNSPSVFLTAMPYYHKIRPNQKFFLKIIPYKQKICQDFHSSATEQSLPMRSVMIKCSPKHRNL